MLADGQAGIAAAERAGDKLLGYVGYGLCAWAVGRLGHYAAALEHWRVSQAIGQEIGEQLAFADWFAAARAELALAQGRVDEAFAQATEVAARAQANGGLFAEGLAECLCGQALAAMTPPQWDEAMAHLTASVSAFESGAAVVEAARTHVVWGTLCCERGDADAAREHFEKVAAQFAALGLIDELERTRALLV